MSVDVSDKETIGFEALRALLQRIFLRHGTNERVAAILADNCAACERDGCHSHGIFRIPGYVASLSSGWVDGRADPVATRVGPSYLRIDAKNGFAQSAVSRFEKEILSILEETGIAVVALRDAHHFSALWPDLEPFANNGYLGLTMVTGGRVVVPPGGRKRILGTNPIAFATPVAGTDPMIFDFATSAMSHGDLRIAADAGRPVPAGTGVDAAGRPTTDPHEIHDGGGILPFGGHKGAALSLMVEILASGLTGGRFSAEVDFTGFPGAETPCTGQVLILLDAARSGNEGFSQRIRAFLDAVRDAGQERLPSDRRLAHRRLSERQGIAVSRLDLARLRALAAEA